MEITTLRTFVEVMQRGSFAAVARERNVDPSSVSRTIAMLEAELGVRLFHRTTRHLSPTEAALAYCAQIEPIIAQIEQAALVAVDGGDTLRGTLRITAPVTFAQVNLTPLLPEFARRHPALAFELLLTDKYLDLIEERIDLAVRLGRLAESSLIYTRRGATSLPRSGCSPTSSRTSSGTGPRRRSACPPPALRPSARGARCAPVEPARSCGAPRGRCRQGHVHRDPGRALPNPRRGERSSLRQVMIMSTEVS